MNNGDTEEGKLYGLLRVVREIHTDAGDAVHVYCKCLCNLNCEVVVSLADLKRKSKNRLAKHRPSCGCVINRPPNANRRQIPVRILNQASPYSLAYESRRYAESKRLDAKLKLQKVKNENRRVFLKTHAVIGKINITAYRILKNKYKCMRSACMHPSNKTYANCGGEGITICKEWLDVDHGFIEYAHHFIPLIPNGTKPYIIERIDKTLGFFPENCAVVICNKPKRKSKKVEVEEIPLFVRARYTGRRNTYYAHPFKVSLGSFLRIEDAVEAIRNWFLENRNETYDDYVDASQLKKHPLYRRWALLNQRESRRLCSRWSKSEHGIQSFRNFLEDLDTNPDYENRMLVRIDVEKKFSPSNVKWTRK